MRHGPGEASGPRPKRPATAREQAILGLARQFALEYPGSAEKPEEIGRWYLRRGAPELIRREFLQVTDREDLLDRHSGKEIEIHLPQGDETLPSVTIWFRNGDRLRDFIEQMRVAGFMRSALSMVALTLPARRRPRARAGSREPATIARVLAIHYLSRGGGGRLTLEAAAELYRATLEDALGQNQQAGRRRRPGWLALPDGWRAERSRVLAELQEEYGPL
jgi:hypothetical protein